MGGVSYFGPKSSHHQSEAEIGIKALQMEQKTVSLILHPTALELGSASSSHNGKKVHLLARAGGDDGKKHLGQVRLTS